MSRFRTTIVLPTVVALLLLGAMTPARAQGTGSASEGRSPARCGSGDVPEPGIQGDVPVGATANYHCGLTLLGELPRIGNVQGAGTCAYIRSGGQIYVVDVTDPTKPVEVGSVPAFGGSETMRAVVTDTRAVLVSGRGVYDIRDCAHPVLKGEIKWPNIQIPGVATGLIPHDIRLNHAATKIYASFGLWEVDITNLDDPTTWTLTNYTCDVAAGYHPIHKQAEAAGTSLCDDLHIETGSGSYGASPLQASLLWPQMSHSPDTNGDDTRAYVGDQAGGLSANWFPEPRVRIVDLTQDPPKLLAEVPGSGHSLDWFQTANGREYVLHANEAGSGDTCKKQRPEALGWAYDAVVTEVTRDKPKRVSKLALAINTPEFCKERLASGHNPWISYHMVDNPDDATFAAVSFGTAGLRIFDIRRPEKPVEAAYFNHGSLVHAGVSHYDAERGLIYAPTNTGLKVLQLQPQVRERLGLDQ